MGKQSRREELLDAALAECVENGYAATGVKEITARAAVSHGTFYNYFDNLLPDSDAIRRRVAERFRTGSTEPFDLLKAIGRDCVGALQFMRQREGDARQEQALANQTELLGMQKQLHGEKMGELNRAGITQLSLVTAAGGAPVSDATPMRARRATATATAAAPFATRRSSANARRTNACCAALISACAPTGLALP